MGGVANLQEVVDELGEAVLLEGDAQRERVVRGRVAVSNPAGGYLSPGVLHSKVIPAPHERVCEDSR